MFNPISYNVGIIISWFCAILSLQIVIVQFKLRIMFGLRSPLTWEHHLGGFLTVVTFIIWMLQLNLNPSSGRASKGHLMRLLWFLTL